MLQSKGKLLKIAQRIVSLFATLHSVSFSSIAHFSPSTSDKPDVVRRRLPRGAAICPLRPRIISRLLYPIFPLLLMTTDSSPTSSVLAHCRSQTDTSDRSIRRFRDPITLADPVDQTDPDSLLDGLDHDLRSPSKTVTTRHPLDSTPSASASFLPSTTLAFSPLLSSRLVSDRCSIVTKANWTESVWLDRPTMMRQKRLAHLFPYQISPIVFGSCIDSCIFHHLHPPVHTHTHHTDTDTQTDKNTDVFGCILSSNFFQLFLFNEMYLRCDVAIHRPERLQRRPGYKRSGSLSLDTVGQHLLEAHAQVYNSMGFSLTASCQTSWSLHLVTFRLARPSAKLRHQAHPKRQLTCFP
ncbi:unnamed protein product [Protopolystoma xenopodis]|uniref:Uncharacterized protein n=1 Tax=Protopolystoma xenopodis TaxID=117903 RepID=A0A3S5B525_9PLAT|nr:unnamed protein product [Protopolystoma xenopodis]